jgi:hypothetical protein
VKLTPPLPKAFESFSKLLKALSSSQNIVNKLRGQNTLIFTTILKKIQGYIHGYWGNVTIVMRLFSIIRGILNIFSEKLRLL